MDRKDDEISIDFSKIKNFFKKKDKDSTSTIETKPQITPENKVEGNLQTPITEQAHPQHTSEIQREKIIDNENNKDDEIKLDFSKIKNIFKKNTSPKGNPVSIQEQYQDKERTKEDNKDEEISIDFSKIKDIKNIFKNNTDTNTGDKDNIHLDIGKSIAFIKKYSPLFLILIPIILSIFLRMQPAYLPITDEWAANSVFDSVRSQIRNQIDQQYPNLPNQNKDALVENELQKILREQGPDIDRQITATSQSFKSRLQDDDGQTYLLAIDPYFWMRHARNILENGNPGDELRDGKPWDNHMLAPAGRDVPFDMFHAYLGAYLYRIMNFLDNDVSLMAAMFFIPVLISALSVIPAFFITRKIAGNFGGFIAALIVAIHPSFLTRTAGGFSDTDAYNVMFPLFISWLFLEAIEARDLKRGVIFSAMGGFLVGLYSFAWSGWWYIFDFIIASAVLYIAYYTFVHRKELMQDPHSFAKRKAIKNSTTFIFVFFIVSAACVSIFVNFEHFTQFSNGPIGFAKLKEVGITRIWPNVYTTVAEQNPSSLDNVINQVGLGKIHFFLTALIGIVMTLVTRWDKKLWFLLATFFWYFIIFLMKIQNLNTFLILITIPIIIRILIALWKSDKDIDIKYGIFLILWFLATTFASTKGIRFNLLLVPAFAIGFGIALGEFYKYTSLWLSKGLHINKAISKSAFIIVVIALLLPTYSSAYATARQEVPSFTDGWRLSLEKIKDDSKPNAIINSWWDFGHWFKYWADRAVTFDGTTQNTAQAHYIGKVLLTSDEKEAMGILRMLDCGERQGFNMLNGLVDDGAEAVDLLEKIIPLDRVNAKEILLRNFDEEQAELILDKTHCEPPENYFITSGDMVGKSGVWAHFGSWDFDRALIYNTLKKKNYKGNAELSSKFISERFGYDEKASQDLFYEVESITTSDQANNWIAPWPGYAGTAGCSNLDNNTLECQIAGIPLIVNLTTNEAYAVSNQGRLYPKKVSFPVKEGIFLREYNESIITLQNGRELGFALVKTGNNYQIVASDSDLTASMFTRMFYQQGVGLEHFKQFSDENSIFGGRILVWKVDWDPSKD
jgi:dolichyl-phosphooligosaccharide-protein glycotransferase